MTSGKPNSKKLSQISTFRFQAASSSTRPHLALGRLSPDRLSGLLDQLLQLFHLRRHLVDVVPSADNVLQECVPRLRQPLGSHLNQTMCQRPILVLVCEDYTPSTESRKLTSALACSVIAHNTVERTSSRDGASLSWSGVDRRRSLPTGGHRFDWKTQSSLQHLLSRVALL